MLLQPLRLGLVYSSPRAGNGVSFQLYLPAGQKFYQDLLGWCLEMAGKFLALTAGLFKEAETTAVPRHDPVTAPHLIPISSSASMLERKPWRRLHSLLNGS